MTNFSNTLLKPATTGAVSAVGLMAMVGSDSNFQIGETKVPVWALGLGLGAASSLTVDLISEYALPHISKDKKLRHFESIALHLSSSGLVFAAVPKLLNSDLNMDEAKSFFMAGVAAEIVGQYIYENFVQPEFGSSDQMLF